MRSVDFLNRNWKRIHKPKENEMILKIFAVKDYATNVFEKPFFMLTKAEAIRAFTREANSKESSLSMHPHDFHLFYLGRYCQDTGIFTQDEGVIDLGSAASYQEVDNVSMFPSKEIEQK